MKSLLLISSLILSGTVLANEAAIKVFKDRKCTDCHSVTAAGVDKIAGEKKDKRKDPPPDLSGTGIEHDAAWITDYLNKKVDKKGKKHKKKFQGTPEELKVISEWLATQKTKK